MYLKIIQDDSISKKQVETILNTKILLNDHGCAIYNFLDKYDCKPWRIITSKFILFGTILSSSLYISCYTQYRTSTSLFTLAILYYISCMEFLRIRIHMDLKSVVSLQNDFFDVCRKGMKILKYGYKIKLNKEKNSQQFSDLTAARLKYLPPIMESLIKYLGDISCIYYHVSLILIKLLPVNFYNEDLLTRFESGSFEIHGEINYQKLKILYHTYILTQSEMLHLLAIAYDNHIWRQSYKKIPELKLAYIIRFLNISLITYKKKLSEHIDAYYSFKLEPYKYKSPDSSQWQDLYMHLYLASDKLQLAYSYVLSILQDIDNDVIENITNEDYMEKTMQKLTVAQKSIETAKDFIEFSNLFLVKLQNNDITINHLETNIPVSVANSDIHIQSIIDSEPEIIDEVFEEYIKEEYLKPLNEATDEISLYNYKRNKALFKNFMSELKDALVEKKKSMSERESQALQRMYKIKENTLNDDIPEIFTSQSISSYNTFSLIHTDNNDKNFDCAQKQQLNELFEKPNITKSNNKENLNERNINILMEEKLPLPRNIEFSSCLSFLKVEEETFIGSGENSEDEEIKIKSE